MFSKSNCLALVFLLITSNQISSNQQRFPHFPCVGPTKPLLTTKFVTKVLGAIMQLQGYIPKERKKDENCLGEYCVRY